MSRNCPVYKQAVPLQEMKTLKKIRYLKAKTVVCSANKGNVSYAQAVKSPPAVTSSPVVKEIIPAGTRFIERYVEEIYTKSQ